MSPSSPHPGRHEADPASSPDPPPAPAQRRGSRRAARAHRRTTARSTWMDDAIAAGRRDYVGVAATHTRDGLRGGPARSTTRPRSSLTVPGRSAARWALRAFGHRSPPGLRAGPHGGARASTLATGAGCLLYGGRNQGRSSQLTRNLRRALPGDCTSSAPTRRCSGR